MLSWVLLASCASSLSMDKFYPFGAANDDENIEKVLLMFFLPGPPAIRGAMNSTSRSPATMLCPSPSKTLITAWWQASGQTFTTDAQTAAKPHTARYKIRPSLSQSAPTSVKPFLPNQLQTASIARCCSATAEAKTFQIVIAFNTDTTLIFLLYANDRPQTILGRFAGAGCNVVDGVRGYTLPGALTAAIGNATRLSSKIGRPGKRCFGLGANQPIGTMAYAGGPYSVNERDAIELQASGGPRIRPWRQQSYTYLLRPGVYTIRAQASSSSPPCPACLVVGSSPDNFVTLSATLTVTGTVLAIRHVYASTEINNNEAHVGELFYVSVDYDYAYCRASKLTLTVDCVPTMW
eukprot:jgi/Chlat1/4882/Chrsp31S04900